MKTVIAMNSIGLFKTPRMVATRLHYSDSIYLYSMYNNPNVMATLGGLPRTQEEIRVALEWNLRQWDENGYGLWIFRPLTIPGFIGRSGLRRIQILEKYEVEVAYSLMPEFWGKGFATEMAKSCIEIAFEVFHFESIICTTLCTNKASQRVMEKVGFNYECNLIHRNLHQVLYRLTQNRYLTSVMDTR